MTDNIVISTDAATIQSGNAPADVLPTDKPVCIFDEHHFIDDVIEATCTRCEVNRDDLLGRGHAQRFAIARHFVTKIARDRASMSFPAIGKALGRDHTTVMSGYARAQGLLQAYKPLRDKINAIEADVIARGWMLK